LLNCKSIFYFSIIKRESGPRWPALTQSTILAEKI
jgi:hypothetical protein